MEGIKVGEYVRTDNGIIGKYVKFSGFEDSIETNNKWIGFDIEKDIVKHSPNIIDLIEEGDYVNGEKVIEVDSFKDWIDIGEEVLSQENVKSIVTKEQFEVMEYKLN